MKEEKDLVDIILGPIKITPVNIDNNKNKKDVSPHLEYMSTKPCFTYKEVEEQFGINLHGFGR